MTESKKQKKKKVKLPNKWFALCSGRKIWWHYQIMICILTLKMNSINVAEICGTLYLVWGCCDGFIILLLRG